MKFELTGRVAIITGGSTGIGAGIALALAEQGVKVILTSRSENFKKLVGELTSAGYDAKGVCLVEYNEQNIEAVIESIQKVHGHCDILVNNIGITDYDELINADIHEWLDIINTNLSVTALWSKAFSKKLIKKGLKGNIINISSNAARYSFKGQSAYSASKAAIVNLTQTLSKELSKYEINVNAVCPGPIQTDLLNNIISGLLERDNTLSDAELVKINISKNQINRFVEPYEIGQIVAFLCSKASVCIRGQAINADAGVTF